MKFQVSFHFSLNNKVMCWLHNQACYPLSYWGGGLGRRGALLPSERRILLEKYWEALTEFKLSFFWVEVLISIYSFGWPVLTSGRFKTPSTSFEDGGTAAGLREQTPPQRVGLYSQAKWKTLECVSSFYVADGIGVLRNCFIFTIQEISWGLHDLVGWLANIVGKVPLGEQVQKDIASGEEASGRHYGQ